MTPKNPNTIRKPKPSSKSAEFELVILHGFYGKSYVAHDRISDQVASFNCYSHAANWIIGQRISRFFEISNLKSEIHL
jgi:hypothetical protein